MKATKPEANKTKIKTPQAIKQTLLYFSIITWSCLILFTLNATFNSNDDNSLGLRNQDYGYFIPVILYGLLLLLFPRIAYTPGQGFRWQKSGGLRRNEDGIWRRIIFIAISFILIGWMNFNPFFIGMYFTLFGHTMGLIGFRYGMPLVVVQLFVLLTQNGLFDQSSRIGSWGILSIAFAVLITLPNMIVITALTTSRIKSERLVQELTATKLQLEEALLKEKEVAILRERDRMAREMHDVLGHALVLVAVKIEAAQRLQAVDPVRAAGELEATKELVRQSMADLRASLADLRSPALEADAKPMAQALKEWAEFTAKEGRFKIECDFEPGTEKLPVPIQDALWRVGREAILNVVKHARAKKVELHLFLKDNLILLSIADDGVGIPHLTDGKARLEVEGHYGMRGMRERLETLGGQLSVKPEQEGKGTRVIASIPLPPNQEAPSERVKSDLSPVKSWLKRGARS